MPRKSKRRRNLAKERTHLVLRIDNYEARVENSVNYYVHETQYAWRDTEDEPQ